MTMKDGRIKKIIASLEEAGATRTILIKAKDVVVDERVRLKCRIPICEAYGQNLMCPPHVPPVEEFRTALAEFSDGLLVQLTASLPKNPRGPKEGRLCRGKETPRAGQSGGKDRLRGRIPFCHRPDRGVLQVVRRVRGCETGRAVRTPLQGAAFHGGHGNRCDGHNGKGGPGGSLLPHRPECDVDGAYSAVAEGQGRYPVG